MYTLEDVYKTFPSGCTEDYKILRAFEMGKQTREKQIAELEKENAELKGLKDVATLIRANNDTVTTLMQLNNKLVSKNQQLTKAKELLERFLGLGNLWDLDCKDYFPLRKEAEQFLKE